MSGESLAADLRAEVRADLDTLAEHGGTPHLGTVLMSDDDAATAYMDRKHEVCADFGIPTSRVDLSTDAPAADLYAAVERLGADDDVTGLFVQAPLPAHVDAAAVRERVPVAKDVDCFAPANLGRLVAGEPRVTPATVAAVLCLLDEYGVETAGQDVVVVGRTVEICRPLANRLLARGPLGDATVTVCHSHTTDLAAKTRSADVLVTAAGTPGLVDGSMLSAGVTVVDISVNRVAADVERGYELVGDVDRESAAEKANAITPVPGGVGPLTLVLLLHNLVTVTARQAGLRDYVDAGPAVL